MTPGQPPFRPPTVTELQNEPLVLQVLEGAWTDSQVDDPTNRHEEGGWIYMELATGVLSVRRAPRGQGASIDLTNPPTVSGAIVVGKFHTHPNPTAEGWDPGPSFGDQQVDARHGVPDLIRADNGIFLSGPVTRRGGLGGGPGYPP
jgi:hypothetical protein